MICDVKNRLQEPAFIELLALSTYDKWKSAVRACAKEYMKDIRVRVLAWMDGNDPIGIIVYRRTARAFEVKELAVCEECRNEGVGSALLKYLCKDAGSIAVGVEADLHALPFYLSNGFFVVNKRDSNGAERYVCMYDKAAQHYNELVLEENDPVLDPEPLQEYMNKWDGDVLLELLSLNKDMRVLEIGVGTGRLALRTAPLCGRFYGIDYSYRSFKRAKEHLRGHNNVALIPGNFLYFEWKDAFDAVYSSLTFMHIREKRIAVGRVALALKPGGRFVVSLDKSRERELIYGERRFEIFPDDPEEMCRHMRDAGLRVTAQKETEFAWIIAAEKNTAG